MPQQALSARRLLNHQDLGVLSTCSLDVSGYPFGSITPFIINYEGEPTILISEIAQHTRNIKNDNRVSLTVFDRFARDPQAGSRLTWIGNAEPIDSSDRGVRDRYSRYFPSSKSYFEAHDFSLYCIRLLKARFIGGFGEIHWLDRVEMIVQNPFREAEQAIVDHMNQDHANALLHYCRGIKHVDTDDAMMVGIDAEGFDIVADGQKLRIDFEVPIKTVEEARAALVKLARA